MTLEEARSELGVSPDAAPDLVRRSYLRLLKTRKPEVDPAGFARLRAAYEVLEAAKNGVAPPRTQPAPAPPRDEQPATSAAAPPPEETVPSEPTARSATTHEQRLDAFRERFSRLPHDAPVGAPVDIAREAVEALPDALEARKWLVQALLAAERADEAAQAYRDAFYQGHSALLLEFARNFPERLTEEELRLLSTVARPSFLWGFAEHLLEAEEWTQLGRVMKVAFETFQRTPDEAPPRPQFFVFVLLRLHEHGHAPAARAVTELYASWLKAEDLMEAFEGEQMTATWAMLQELAALDDTFPSAVRMVLARLPLRGSQLPTLHESLRAYRRREPALAASALASLQQRCPLYLSVFGEDLAADTRPGHDATGQTGATPGRASSFSRTGSLRQVGLIALILVTVFGGVAVMGVVVEYSQRSLREHRLEVAGEAATALCSVLPESDREATCAAFQRMVTQAAARDCLPFVGGFTKLRVQLHQRITRDTAPGKDSAESWSRMTQHLADFEAALRPLCHQS
ncbi:J domain-containing protein [Myxococcus sp. K15C18031901]|uniref:J domain-containing protein n=1 Tax=Myxococcus dinghuensis TaxID=2906761 RepID=UPI0020A7F804|nr:J domain-containing protein [Myxococcus dinghuensis]MCP3103210.1 J domain-containing protein [Myxococcus dinghuensis]